MREVWEYSAPAQTVFDDGEIAVTVKEDGVLVAVTQEHAVDSYNSIFTCSVILPLEKVAELVAVLSRALSHEKANN